MKNLTDWFDRVYVINCQTRPDRLQETKDHLSETKMADIGKVVFYPAIIGSWTTVPADWLSGEGAWGCRNTHARILEDVIHTRNDEGEMTLKNILILEDDVVFVDKALQKFNEFIVNVPVDWGQIYLGGQHRGRKLETEHDNVIDATSINRTHAHAINKPYYQQVYRHITYASDYRGKKNHHVDHQLEVAHRRGDWPVYCPKKWLVGQRAGKSDISGKTNPTKFW